MPGIFISSASRTEVDTSSPSSQTRELRFAPHERSHLLLTRGVSLKLVEMLESAGFSSLAAIRQLGVGAVLAELASRFGKPFPGVSHRGLERALSTFVSARAPQLMESAQHTVTAATSNGRPLMVDIARAAGVSLSTVSRALDDSELVNPQTKARIRQLAQASHYARNTTAQSLRTRRARTVTVMMSKAEAADRCVDDAQDLALIGSLADALDEAGFELNLSRPRSDRIAQLREMVAKGHSAGLVVLGNSPDLPADLPVVCWGNPGHAQACPFVGVDTEEGARLATQFLLSTGARRVVFVPDTDAAELQAQHSGYLQAHHEWGLAPATSLDLETLGEADIVAAMNFLGGGSRVDGVVAASDWSALAAVRHLRDMGLRVPDDVSVVGCGDTPLAMRASLALTTLQPPIRQAGQALVRLLLERMAGRQPDSVLLAPRLVVRASTRSH